MQPWRRWREPLAVVLLVAVALSLVLRTWLLLLAAADENSLTFFGSPSGGDNLLLLAAALAVLWCVAPLPDDETPGMSPHAWPIAVAGLVIVGLTVLGWLVMAVLNLDRLAVWPTPDIGFVLQILDGLLQLAIPVVSLVAVVLAVRRTAAARRTQPERTALPAAPSAAGSPADVPEIAAAPERLPAAWQADEATGAVWLTADDAAEGRPGLSWSDPSTPATEGTRGWTPTPGAGASDPPATTRADTTPVPERPTAGPPAERPSDQDDDLR